jgi:outer membrane protein assembly factor BamA
MSRNQPKKLFLLLVCWLLVLSGSVRAADEIDTTRVREPKKHKRSFSETIAQVPSTVLKVPVYFFKGITYGVVKGAFDSPLRRVFNIGNPISPFFLVAGYSSNSGFKGGLGYRYLKHLTPGDKLKFKTSYSTNRYQSYQLKYLGPRTFGEEVGFNLLVRYRKRPRENLHGIGMLTAEDDEVSFNREETLISSGLVWHTTSLIDAEMFGGYTATNISDGEDPGLEGNLDSIRQRFALEVSDTRSTRFLTIGGRLSADWRDHVGQPSRGGLAAISLSYNKGTGDSKDMEFSMLRFDAVEYLNLFRKRILAVRLLTRMIDKPDDAPNVPFYLKSLLGGQDDLRAYERGRFLDYDLALISVEYRYPLYHIIDAFVFLDEARVFHDISDELTLRGWRYSAGVGIRVWNSQGVLLKTQAAYGDEGLRLYLDVGSDW